MPDYKPTPLLFKLRIFVLQYRKYAAFFPLIVLLIANVIIYVYLIWSAVTFFAGRESYLRAIEEIGLQRVAVQEFWQRNRPEPLRVDRVGAIPHTAVGGTLPHDFYVRVQNPNERWLATFRYRFRAAGYEGIFAEGFILPGEESYLTDLSARLPQLTQNAELEIADFRFRRASDFARRKPLQFNFSFSDIQFVPGDTVTFPKTIFSVKNLGAASFWQVKFLIVLFSGSQIVGVNTVTLERLESLKTRGVEVVWFEKIPFVSSTRIIPEVNIYDEAVFMEVTPPPSAF